jgi:hypothetical protein
MTDNLPVKDKLAGVPANSPLRIFPDTDAAYARQRLGMSDYERNAMDDIMSRSFDPAGARAFYFNVDFIKKNLSSQLGGDEYINNNWAHVRQMVGRNLLNIEKDDITEVDFAKGIGKFLHDDYDRQLNAADLYKKTVDRLMDAPVSYGDVVEMFEAGDDGGVGDEHKLARMDAFFKLAERAEQLRPLATEVRTLIADMAKGRQDVRDADNADRAADLDGTVSISAFFKNAGGRHDLVKKQVEDAAKLKEYITKLARLPDGDLALIYEMITAKGSSETSGERGAADNMAETLGRGLVSVLDKHATTLVDSNRLANGAKVLKNLDNIKIPKAVQSGRGAGMHNLSSSHVHYSGLDDVIDRPGVFIAGKRTGWRPLTGDEKAQLREKAENEAAVYNVTRRVRELANGVVDPVRGDNFFTDKMLYPAMESLPHMAQAFIPYAGIPLLVSANYGDSFEQMIDRGVAADDAQWMAAVATGPMTLLDFVESKLMIGRVPGLGRALSNLKASGFSKLAARAGITAAAEWGTETAVEVAQDLMPLLAQELGHALKEEIPGVDWDEYRKKFWGNVAEIGLVMVPLTLIGTGAAVGRDVSYLQDRRLLQAAGLTDAAISQMESATDAESASALLRTIWDNHQLRKPGSAEAKAAMKELSAALEGQAQLVRGGATIRRRGDAYEVRDSRGKRMGNISTIEKAWAAKMLHDNFDDKLIESFDSSGKGKSVDPMSGEALQWEDETDPGRIAETREWEADINRRRPADDPISLQPVRLNWVGDNASANTRGKGDDAGVSDSVRTGPVDGGKGAAGSNGKMAGGGGAVAGRLKETRIADALIRGFEKLYHKRVIFVRASKPWHNGLVSGDRANTILINADSRAPVQTVLGHEFGHQIKMQNPALWEEMRDLIERVSPMSEEYRQKKLGEGYKSDKIIDEWVSDVIGQHFDDKNFWEKLRYVAEKRGQGGRFKEFVGSILDWIEDLFNRFRMGLDREADNVAKRAAEEIRNKIANALVRFAEDMPAGGYSERAGASDTWASTGEAAPMDDTTAAQRAELKRQYDAVVAAYTNADGTKKPGWLKAPNGEPTKLTERQWVHVRTPAFKRFFGDWEGAAEMLHKAKSFDEARAILASLAGQIFTNRNSGLQGSLSMHSINKILSGKAHTKSVSIAAHLHAAANIISLFERGEVLQSEPGKKGEVKTSHKVFAPFVFGGNPLVAKVTVHEYTRQGGNRIYSVEAMEILNPAVNSAPVGFDQQSNPLPDSVLTRLHEMAESVKSENVSKVVDENGEPLVLWHGSSSEFSIFRPNSYFANADMARKYAELSAAEYHYPPVKDPKEALYGVFLNARNVLKLPDDDFDAANLLSEKGALPKDWMYKMGLGRIWHYLEMEEVREALSKAGYDAVEFFDIMGGLPSRSPNYHTAILSLNGRNAVKSATGNSGAYDAANPDIYVSTGSETMVTAHNLSASNLLHAVRLGGKLAVPSLAVIDARNGFEGFGEITLLGGSSLADPGAPGNRVFDADVYSPRYPRVERRFRNRDELLQFEREILDLANRNGYEANYMDVEAALDGRRVTEVLVAAYLNEKGIPIPINQKYGSPSPYLYTQEGNNEQAVLKWVREKLSAYAIEERIFLGFTPSGNRRYAAHTLENIVRAMSGKVRGEEGMNFGVGSIRSAVAKRFKSLEGVKKGRGRLVDKATMDNLKEEANAGFDVVAEALKPAYKYESSGFGYYEAVANALADWAGGHRDAFSYSFNALSEDQRKTVRDFLAKLKAMPSEYFEAKPKRAVGLDEFAAAVAPSNMADEVRDALKGAGLEVYEYDEKQPDARRAVVAEAARRHDLMFSAGAEPLSDGASGASGTRPNPITRWLRDKLRAERDELKETSFKNWFKKKFIDDKDAIRQMEHAMDDITDAVKRLAVMTRFSPDVALLVEGIEDAAEALRDFVYEYRGGLRPGMQDKLEEMLERFDALADGIRGNAPQIDATLARIEVGEAEYTAAVTAVNVELIDAQAALDEAKAGLARPMDTDEYAGAGERAAEAKKRVAAAEALERELTGAWAAHKNARARAQEAANAGKAAENYTEATRLVAERLAAAINNAAVMVAERDVVRAQSALAGTQRDLSETGDAETGAREAQAAAQRDLETTQRALEDARKMKQAAQKTVSFAEALLEARKLASEMSALVPKPAASTVTTPGLEDITARLRNSVDGVVIAMIENGMVDFNGRTVGGALKEAVAGLDDAGVVNLDRYLLAKRALAIWNDTKQSGRNPGIPKAEAEKTVAELESDDFIRRAKLVYAWNQGVDNYAAQASTAMALGRDKMMAVDPGFYVPLWREGNGPDGYDDVLAPDGGPTDRFGKPLTGDEAVSTLWRPLDALMKQAEIIVRRAHDRHLWETARAMALSNPLLSDFIREVDESEVLEAAGVLDEAREELDAAHQAELDAAKAEAGAGEAVQQAGEAAATAREHEARADKTAQLAGGVLAKYKEKKAHARGRVDSALFEDLVLDENYVYASDGGKWWAIRKELFDSLNSLNVKAGKFGTTMLAKAIRETAGVKEDEKSLTNKAIRTVEIIDWMLKLSAKSFRAGATGLRASFGLGTNIVRDFMTMQYNTRVQNDPLLVAKNWFKAMTVLGASALRGRAVLDETQTARYHELTRNLGMHFSNSLTFDSERLGIVMAKITHDKDGKINWKGEAAVKIDTVWQYFVNVIQFPEMAARIAEMRSLAEKNGWDITKGLNAVQIAEFARAGKEVTVDFTRAGEWARIWNRYVPFINSSIQGKKSSYDAMRRNPVGWLLNRGLVASVAAAVNWFFNKDDEWWKELTAGDRFAYDFVKLGGSGEVLRIPRSFEVDAIFKGLVVEMLDAAYNEQPDRVMDWFKGFVEEMTVAGSLDTGINMDALPPALREGISQIANHDFYWKSPIVSRTQQELAWRDQFGPYTSHVAVRIGDILNIPPRRIDHAIGGLFAGVGGDLMALFGRGPEWDAADVPFIGAAFKDSDWEPYDTPVLGRAFFRRGGEEIGGNRTVDRLYDTYGRMREESSRIEGAGGRLDGGHRELIRAMSDAIRAVQVVGEARLVATTREQRQELSALRFETASMALQTLEDGTIGRHAGEFRRLQRVYKPARFEYAGGGTAAGLKSGGAD